MKHGEGEQNHLAHFPLDYLVFNPILQEKRKRKGGGGVSPSRGRRFHTFLRSSCPSSHQVSELATVKSQFEKKYGSEYVRMAETNDDGCVNPKVVDRLDCMPPSPYVVTVRGERGGEIVFSWFLREKF